MLFDPDFLLPARALAADRRGGAPEMEWADRLARLERVEPEETSATPRPSTLAPFTAPAALHAEDAPAAPSSDSARPPDYETSGFAPMQMARASTYSSARFAADLLAAPSRTDKVAQAEATWLGESRAAEPAPAAFVTEPAPPSLATPVWTSPPPFTAPARETNTFATAAAVGSVTAGPRPEAFTPSGSAYAWGLNNYGQLGNNSTTTSAVPVPVASANGFTNTGVTAVAGGQYHSLALQNGTVYSWGSNSNGQLGDNLTTNSDVPVAVSSANGFTNTGVTAVAAGASHSLAIQNGVVYDWGYNGGGQLGNNSTTDSDTPVAVLGTNGFTNTNVTAIAGGTYHSLAVQNGTVYSWGYNYFGQLGNNSTTQSNVPVPVASANGFTNTNVTAIAAGDSHNLAVQNGAAYAWGLANSGQLGNGSTTQSNVPVAVLGLSTGVTSVAAGYAHSLAVQNGNVFAWGANNDGQLGNNSTTNSAVPVEVSYGGSFLGGIVQVAAAAYSSYALSRDGSLYVWGLDYNGQLGDGSTNEEITPEHLLPPGGEYYQLIESDGVGTHVVAILGDTPPVVPEPGTWAGGVLLTLGVLGLTLRRRVRRV